MSLETADDVDRIRPPLQNTSSPSDNEPPEIKKLLEWQQARLARKLRGEHESFRLNLSQLVNEELDAPLALSAVRVLGAKHTRQSFLNSLIQPHFSPDPTSSTLGTVLNSSRRISDILQQADIFHSVDAHLERAQSSLAGPDDVDLVLRAREKGKFFLKTSTEVGNSDGSVSILARLRNIFGGAETLEANVAFGTVTRKSFQATLSAPVSADLLTRVDLSAFGLQKDLSSYASCTEEVRGVRSVLRHGLPAYGAHELGYEAVLRNIGGLSPKASMSIREAAGQSFKSSLTHSYTLDNRDDRMYTKKGMFFKLAHELAGLGGDTAFYKAETESQIARPLSNSVSVSLGFRSGLLWGLSGKPALFPDRFQLGGPLSVRSFKTSGLGPRDGDDYVGGDIYYSAGVSVISDIPTKGHWPLKTHLWLNAGRLDNINQSSSFSQTVASSLSQPSISAGVGLVYRFDPVRVELNLGMPLAASKSDATRRGFQAGIGLEFL